MTWHDIITVYGYEIIVSTSNTTQYINTLIKIKESASDFRIYTLVCSVNNGWDEKQVTADDIFPVIGFKVPNVVSEFLTLRNELSNFLQDNPPAAYEGISYVITPKIYSGIDVNSIRSDEDELYE
jgi:hypothetical protein